MIGRKNTIKGKKKVRGILIVVFLCFIVIMFKMSRPYYSEVSRVDKIEKYSKLYDEKNISVRGWVRVQGTDIDYPIIDEYMANQNGINGGFTWTSGYYDKLPNKLSILGHNVRNVSSHPLITNKDHTDFEQLPSFMYLNFVKDNKYVQVTIDEKNYLYKIYAVSIFNYDDYSFISGDYEKEELSEYIDSSLKESFYDFDIDVNSNDKLLALVTCNRFYGYSKFYGLKVDARLVRDGEKIRNYNVRANDNYKEIKKTMEGDENE